LEQDSQMFIVVNIMNNDLNVGANCVRPMPTLPIRKINRLQGYDYSQNGAYFITVCAKDRKCLFGKINGVHPVLTNIGHIIESEIAVMAETYDAVRIGCHVIMPNHVHMIIFIENGRTQFAPTISRIIKQWKGAITKIVGFSPWQKSFHDRIIRNDDEYCRIVEYIENNPEMWHNDDLRP